MAAKPRCLARQMEHRFSQHGLTDTTLAYKDDIFYFFISYVRHLSSLTATEASLTECTLPFHHSDIGGPR